MSFDRSGLNDRPRTNRIVNTRDVDGCSDRSKTYSYINESEFMVK